MDKQLVVQKTMDYLKDKLKGEGTGHDWWHMYRVYKNAVHIAQSEDVDMFLIELAALLHDIADYKFTNGDENEGSRQTRAWLESLNVDEDVIQNVCDIVKLVGFKGGGNPPMRTYEGMVVEDADRLDAMGAIGIARAFAYGGHMKREIYNPDVKPNVGMTKEEYKKNMGSSINHFYEKLLLLKDRMNTQTAKKMAEKRHEFMEAYLEEFFKEWEGEV